MKGLIAAAGRERTAARPGPGAITAESLEALELAIARRVDGLLAGDYRSACTWCSSLPSPVNAER